MPESTSHQLVFSLGSEEYALPIGTVHEIIRFSEPRSVASEVPWIRGIGVQVLESIEAGAKDFVVKPFQPDRVIEAVGKALA